MTEMAPEALVPDVWRQERKSPRAQEGNRGDRDAADSSTAWRCEPAPCPHGPHPWHAEPRGTCETSCLAPVVIHPRLTIPPNVVLGED